jgi:superfamily II DNA or RNA helicase
MENPKDSNELLEEKLLCLYAYHIADLDAQELQRFAKEEDVKINRIHEIVERNAAAGVLQQGVYDWYGNNKSYHIHPDHYLRYALLLIEHKDDKWIDQYLRVIKRGSTRGNYVFKTLQLTLHNVRVDINKQWEVYNLAEYFWCIFRFPKLYTLTVNLLEVYMEDLTCTSITRQQELDDPDTANDLLLVVNEWEKRNHHNLNEVRAMLALNHFMATGEYLTSRATKQTTYGLLLDSHRLSLQGHYAQALKGYEVILRGISKQSQVKGIFLDPFDAYFHVLTLVHEGSDESKKRAARYNTPDYLNTPYIRPARLIANYFFGKEHYVDRDELSHLATHERIYRIFAFQLSRYTHTELEGLQRPGLPRYAILRHELSAFLPLTEEDSRQLKEAYGDTPLLTSIQFKEPWQYALERILATTHGEGAQAEQSDEERSTRMGYILSAYGSVEPREQTRLRNGQWGAGKLVSTSRYLQGNLDFMDQRDRNVWDLMQHSHQIVLTPELLLPEMVGTDRVYTGHMAPYTPITITEEKPYLTIERDKESFVVRANYEPTGNYRSSQSATHIVTQRDYAEWVVIPLEGSQRRIFEELLRIRRFPLNAEEALKAFFPQVNQLIEVHSATFAEGNTLETVDGSPVIYLQVSPIEDAFHLQCVVRPLPGGQLTFVPGKGQILIPDEAEGRRVQVRRPLKEERQRFQDLSDYVDDLTDLDHAMTGGEINLEGAQLLSLIDYIRPLEDRYVMEWQEGQPLRVKKPAEPKAWQIGLTGQGGWFELEGDVQLDDHTLLSMAQLLELIGNQRGEFIRLSDHEYLQLTESLRRQLSRLESVAVRQKGRVRIPSLTAGLLSDDTLRGDFTIQADRQLTELRSRIAESATLRPKVPTKLKATLRDYQVEGFQWIARLNHWGAGACLADDMGLGKTVQTIAYLIYMAKEGASLVVAPTSVVPNWQKEVARFAPSLHIIPLNSSADRPEAIRQAGPHDVVITSYGLLMSESEALLAKPWNIVCLDEAHTIKNRETKTSACAMQLQAAHRLILTGTPVQNHLGELWNLFQFINPGLLGSYEQFQQKYILPIEVDHDKQRQQQLNRLVHPFMLRRTKHEVVEELPDKEEIVYPVEMTDAEMAVYETIRREAKQMVEDGGAKVNVATLAMITKLRQAACCAQLIKPKWKGGSSKIDRLVDLLHELQEGGHRALVFSQFTSFFALIRKQLDAAKIPYLYLDGSTPVRQRQQLVEEFQQGDCPFFLISLKAGGLGLNLTGANYIIHLDPWWNPAIEQQATDRAYRIGQTQKVTAYHLVSAHTIEEKILRLHATKRNLSDALLSGTDMSHKLTAKDLLKILEEGGEEG